MKRKAAAILATLALASEVAPAHAEPRFALEAAGGTVLHLGAGDETGNAFGGIMSVRWGPLALGFGTAVTMPDARLQGQFTALWGEVRYHFQRAWDILEPYGTAGVGGSTGDGFTPSEANFVPVRWSPDGGALGFIGAGLRLGRAHGMSLAFDARVINASHLGLQILLGFTL
jgi:hypothetical protein